MRGASAARLHIHPTSLAKLVKAGDLISGQKVKGRWEIEESEVARLLATRCDQPVDRISSRGRAFGPPAFFV